MRATVMMERTPTTMPNVGSLVAPTPTSSPTMPGNMVMVPCCTMKIEKCTGGVKIHCTFSDKTAASMVQHLCSMVMGGMCSCSMMMNGMHVCQVNFTMGICRCELTDSGVCITCTSGDAQCCEMIQACGECCTVMMKNGCSCLFMINQVPVCCGTCETTSGTSAGVSKVAANK